MYGLPKKPKGYVDAWDKIIKISLLRVTAKEYMALVIAECVMAVETLVLNNFTFDYVMTGRAQQGIAEGSPSAIITLQFDFLGTGITDGSSIGT